ncbi:MAG: hypothetical protein K9H16_11175 [Bacteroidales bacterium]|nr:hypothetical protein [Bacteroidales bacterium]
MAEYDEIQSLEIGCLNCLQYFGIFRYPLKLEEVYQFNPVKSTLLEVEHCLGQLVAKGSIFNQGDFYLIHDKKEWITERIAGNKRADLLLKKSPKYAGIISAFPFVQSIAISGSLSKNYASEDPDIDYFIITDIHRLWIARTLLHLFKKLTFVTGHQHFFCMNYFIDTEALALKQRNQYAAIELATLIPVYNKQRVMELIGKNDWMKQFLPNHNGVLNCHFMIPTKKQPIKKLLEKLLNMLFPVRLNIVLMKITDKKWRKKWRHQNFTHEEYEQALQTEIHISKNHPDNYEKLVLDSLTISNPKSSVK